MQSGQAVGADLIAKCQLYADKNSINKNYDFPYFLLITWLTVHVLH